MSNVALVDVHQVDGEPWEVASVAAEQLKAAIELSVEALEGMEWAGRGAWLSQQYQWSGEMPDGADWMESPLWRQIDKLRMDLAVASKLAVVLQAATANDPRSV